MAQWEMCRVTSQSWNWRGTLPRWDHEQRIVVYYFTPTGVITRFPSINSWGQAIAILGAAEWEVIAIEDGVANEAVVTGINRVHPSGDNGWQFEYCTWVAYFKRSIQAGRNIDDAL